MRPLLFSLLLVFGIANAEAAVTDISRIYREKPSLDSFDVCAGGGCAVIHHVALNSEEWQRVVDAFISVDVIAPLQKSEQERQQIALAIGVLETIIGDKTATDTDRAGTFNNSDYSGQLDCNDEAINTTSYMRLMVQTGLVKLHVVEDMRTRNFFFSGWPHSTAVIHEVATGQRYAVDSWFYDNGLPATIVPFALWKSGFIPDDSPINHIINSNETAQHSAE